MSRFAKARRPPKLMPVESSSIESVGYDPGTRRLYVRFLQSGKAYVYYDVEEDVFEDLLAANSKGAFFNSEIRGAFSYHQL